MRRAGLSLTVGLCSAFHVLPRSVERSRSRDARGEERAAGAVDRVEPGLRDVLALDGRERVPAVGGAAQAGGAGEEHGRGRRRGQLEGAGRRARVERLPGGAAVVGAEEAARRVQRVADEGRREGDVDHVLGGRDVAARPRLAAVGRLGERAVVARGKRRARLAAGAHARVGPAEAPADRGEVQPGVVGDRRGAGGAARGDARGRGEASGEDRVLRGGDEPRRGAAVVGAHQSASPARSS